mmetsp:Transcript_15801/g.44211  ORF Transcript_15801/g.44211 Transcript_15801/m.44211 type:complete len:334 (-) Transcript_15801:2046-3047(-)
MNGFPLHTRGWVALGMIPTHTRTPPWATPPPGASPASRGLQPFRRCCHLSASGREAQSRSPRGSLSAVRGADRSSAMSSARLKTEAAACRGSNPMALRLASPKGGSVSLLSASAVSFGQRPLGETTANEEPLVSVGCRCSWNEVRTAHSASLSARSCSPVSLEAARRLDLRMAEAISSVTACIAEHTACGNRAEDVLGSRDCMASCRGVSSCTTTFLVPSLRSMTGGCRRHKAGLHDAQILQAAAWNSSRSMSVSLAVSSLRPARCFSNCSMIASSMGHPPSLAGAVPSWAIQALFGSGEDSLALSRRLPSTSAIWQLSLCTTQSPCMVAAVG